MDIDFHSPDLERLSTALERFAARGVPYAARNTLNRAAFAGRTEWADQAATALTLRNRWTARSMRVEKARGRDVRRMEARLGSVAAYMAIQERGETKTMRGAHGVPIPTSVASGEGRNKQPRRRVVRRPNRMPSIRLGSRGSSSLPRRQRNAIAMSIARASGRKFVFLDLGQRQGIFRLAGGKRRPRVDLVWDLSRSSVRIPATSTLEKTMEVIERRLPRLATEALREQLRRNRVIGV